LALLSYWPYLDRFANHSPAIVAKVTFFALYLINELDLAKRKQISPVF
jgi:hypothetical protein